MVSTIAKYTINSHMTNYLNDLPSIINYVCHLYGVPQNVSKDLIEIVTIEAINGLRQSN